MSEKIIMAASSARDAAPPVMKARAAGNDRLKKECVASNAQTVSQDIGSPCSSGTLERSVRIPARGWMVTATTPDGRVIEQQFLVALEDCHEAVLAAKRRADPTFVVALGASVDGEHFIRRKMKSGDVFELGSQRIARGKNFRRSS